MKTRSQVSALVLLCLVLGCQRDQTAKPAYRQPVDLTGEWAIEWEDKRPAYKETIYVWITHNASSLAGSALDPNLIPAGITGQVVRPGEVKIEVAPKEGRGFHAPMPPVSTFKGTITGTNSMEGKYRVRGQRGPWRATRTATGTNRTVFVSAQTKLTIPLTSEEYDTLYSLQTPLRASDQEYKDSLRAGDHYLVEEQIGELGGWLYHYRFLGDLVRINPAMGIKESQLQRKILESLNEHGYPWKSIPP